MSDSITVLDKGFVTLVDHMGTDCTVVNAARISFGKKVLEMSDKDVKLIQYLAKHKHWTPFAHPQLTFHIKMPIFVARQFMKSCVGVVYNEISRRYVDDPPEFHEPVSWRSRPEGSLKQGSGSHLEKDAAHYAGVLMQQAYDEAASSYYCLIRDGVAPEQARIVLPVSMYTEVWATMSLQAAARIVGLRQDSHAQWEIQQYANAMDTLTSPLFPVSWAALVPPQDTK